MIGVSVIVSVLRRGIQKYEEISDRNWIRIEWDRTHRRGKNTTRCVSLFYKLGFVFLFLSLVLFVCVFTTCVTLHLRIANQVGEDSRCRGGIVHTRGGCSRALFVRQSSPTALWRFRASTSNSPSGRTWLHTHTPMR